MYTSSKPYPFEGQAGYIYLGAGNGSGCEQEKERRGEPEGSARAHGPRAQQEMPRVPPARHHLRRYDDKRLRLRPVQRIPVSSSALYTSAFVRVKLGTKFGRVNRWIIGGML